MNIFPFCNLTWWASFVSTDFKKYLKTFRRGSHSHFHFLILLEKPFTNTILILPHFSKMIPTLDLNTTIAPLEPKASKQTKFLSSSKNMPETKWIPNASTILWWRFLFYLLICSFKTRCKWTCHYTLFLTTPPIVENHHVYFVVNFSRIKNNIYYYYI